MVKKAAKKKASKKKAAKKKAPARRARWGKAIPKAVESEIQRTEAAVFVREVVKHNWDLEAAVLALWPEVKAEDAKEVASMLIRKAPDEMIEGMRAVQEGAQLTAEWAAEALIPHVDASILDYLDGDGKIRPIDELKRLPRARQRAIRRLHVSTTENLDRDGNVTNVITSTSLELYDAQKAIEVMGKILRWEAPVQNQNNIAVLMMRGEERAAQAMPAKEYYPRD